MTATLTKYNDGKIKGSLDAALVKALGFVAGERVMLEDGKLIRGKGQRLYTPPYGSCLLFNYTTRGREVMGNETKIVFRFTPEGLVDAMECSLVNSLPKSEKAKPDKPVTDEQIRHVKRLASKPDWMPEEIAKAAEVPLYVAKIAKDCAAQPRRINQAA